MANYLPKNQKGSRALKPMTEERKQRFARNQVVRARSFMEAPERYFEHFERTITVLYGPPGIGKTTLESLIPNIYILDNERGAGWQKCRSSQIDNWKTFVDWINWMEERPDYVAKVSMWGIDTIDGLIESCKEKIADDSGTTDIADQEWSRGWDELRWEVRAQLLRLADLGPGILILSHERMVEKDTDVLKKIKEVRMNLSPSIFNTINAISDCVIHMKLKGAGRCLVTRGSLIEDAKDCTGRELPPILPFTTEQEAVDKILDAFGGPMSLADNADERSSPTHKKTKKVKKKAKKTS